MKRIAIVLAHCFAVCVPTLAVDLEPLMTTPGKLLVNEDFAAAKLPRSFIAPRTPDSFRIVDGALEAITLPKQAHSTHGVFKTETRDLTVALSVKFVKPGTLYIGIDGYKEEFKGNTHLVRFSLAADRMAWDEKRGGAESKHAVGEAMKAARAAKQPIPEPTADQLADPSFFRTVELASKSIDDPAGQWYHVLLEVNGNDLVAQVDGQTLIAKATVADAMKNRIGLGFTGRGTTLIDDVRIWENTRRSDAERLIPAFVPPK